MSLALITHFSCVYFLALIAFLWSHEIAMIELHAHFQLVLQLPGRAVRCRSPRKKIESVRTLPQKTTIVHNGTNYYYSNHKFYTYSKGNYITIQPKVGFRMQTLPTGYIRVTHLNRIYFWFNGIFYIQVDNQYEVVDPEIGTIIYELPSEYERVEIDNNTYYEFGNVLYEKVQINGTRAYEVVGFIEQ